MAGNALKTQQLTLKGRIYTFTVLQLAELDIERFAQSLQDMISKAPKMFENMPLVLDLSLLKGNGFDLQGTCQLLKTNHVMPIAIQNASPYYVSVATCMGLAVLNPSSANEKDIPLATEEITAKAEAYRPSKTITTPVRSGQQVVGKNGDLVVIASVGHGAELLADGNIHVYGTLRGRALAGISGNTEARIFCQSLDAELVSIAGFYRLSDAMEAVLGPCQIFLKDEQIHIEPL